MSVAVVLKNEKQAAQVLPWAVKFARAKETNLLAIVVKKKREKGKSRSVSTNKGTDQDSTTPIDSGRWSDVDLANLPDNISIVEKAIAEQAIALDLRLPVEKTSEDSPSHDRTSDESKGTRSSTPSASKSAAVTLPGVASETSVAQVTELSGPVLTVRQFSSSDPVNSLPLELATMTISLLIIPKSIDGGSDRTVDDWHENLYLRAPCQTMFLHEDRVRECSRLRVLCIVNGTTDDRSALQTGFQLATSTGGELTAMFFEPAIDDWATQVGDRILDRIVRSELGRNSTEVKQKTVLASGISDGLGKLQPAQYDIVLFGSRQRRQVNACLQTWPGGPNSDPNSDAPAIAAIRNAVPYTSQLVGRIQNVIQRYVPQLTRPERISLFEKVQTSSQWDFDFVALISLSTMIAALGLVDNSIPVVIGAMLVAPLMTPIIAIGLGLAQGNLMLIKTSFRTVRHGFVTAFLIGILLGFAVFTFAISREPTSEMAARDLPGFIDLMVALVGGIAAAYALSRPNLSEAIPGVAIAAALVPPLATAGLSVSLGQWTLALGASLLFLTNVIAIVLGASLTFWLVGVRTDRQDNRVEQWPRWLMLYLLLATLILTAILEIAHHPHWVGW